MAAPVNQYATFAAGPAGPFFNSAVVTPSDTVYFSVVSGGLYVGVAGDITAVTPNGQTVLLKAVPVGWYPGWHFSRINNTATAATNMVIFW